jgi:hypothetical protein
MLGYVDERDDNELILTHIYLILGVSYGIFVVYFDYQPCMKITALIG